jgi:glyoxylase-like metal-dependent hydrolase (beta-lactamase superfamily II)
MHGTEYQWPDATIYPDITTQLAALGVQPEEITHVVVTHHHTDHIAGLTVERAGTLTPVFPDARYFLGRADWDLRGMQEIMQHPEKYQGKYDVLKRHTLGILHNLGKLELVEGDLELAPGLDIQHLPGETPGHQGLRLQSGGQTLYCLGDLYHHTSEIEHPSWMAPWDDPATMLASRHKLTKAALAEEALLVITHVPSVGILRPHEDHFHYHKI